MQGNDSENGGFGDNTAKKGQKINKQNRKQRK